MINSLYISNFKGFKEIQIPELGHLNLIVGKNNSGKSTILEDETFWNFDSKIKW